MRLRTVLLWSVPVVPAAAAAALTLLRLWGPESGPGIRLVSFTQLAALGHLFALLWLGVALVRGTPARGTRRRRVALALAAVPLLGVAVHGWWWAPYWVGDVPEAADGPRLTVMTVNMLTGDADPEAVVELVRRHDVDLLAVQEVEPSTLLALEQAAVNEELPFHGGEAVYGASGTMLLSRHPITAERPVATKWTSFTADVDVDGEQVRVVVTHPESPMGRARSWRRDLEAVRSALVAEEPDLLLGDLNSTQDHDPFRRLLETGMRDVVEVANDGFRPTWPSAGQVRVLGVPVPRLLPIDHVLVGPGWTGWGSRVEEVPGSDHAALLAEVAPRRSPREP